MSYVELVEDEWPVLFAGFGLTKYPAVGKFQWWLNQFADRIGASKISEDQKYGSATQSLYQKVMKDVFGLPESYTAQGPGVAAALIVQSSGGVPSVFGADEIRILQNAYSEYKSGSTTPSGGGGGGGGEDLDITEMDIMPPQTSKAGLGTLGWVLIGAVVVAGAYGGYVYGTKQGWW